MNPLDVARRMLRANCDTGLIMAYLRLELEKDPTWNMTPMQLVVYRVKKAMEPFARAMENAKITPPGAPLSTRYSQSDYVRIS